MSHKTKERKQGKRTKNERVQAFAADRWSAEFMEKELKDAVTIDFADYKTKSQDILEEYGFVVITGVLSQQERTDAEALLYEDLLESIDDEKITDPKLKRVVKDIRDSKLHWPKSSIPGIVKKGFMCLKGFPQGKFAWGLRTNKKCKQIYQFLHDENDLVVGEDLPFFNPDTTPNSDSDMWPHADQNVNLKEGCDKSYQGILYVWDSTKHNTSNTVVWPKSWKNEYHTLLEGAQPLNMGTTMAHGIYVKEIADSTLKEKMFNDWKKHSRRVQVPAGALLIFNSRTIHQGYPSGTRLAQTLSWEPKRFRREDALIRKVQAMHMGIGTTHWASLGIHHGASFMKSYKPPAYSDRHHNCVIPMKQIPSVAVTEQIRWCKDKKHSELMEKVKEEYRDII